MFKLNRTVFLAAMAMATIGIGLAQADGKTPSDTMKDKGMHEDTMMKDKGTMEDSMTKGDMTKGDMTKGDMTKGDMMKGDLDKPKTMR
jgi:pentapeptide MXKDX repeat protein